MSPLPESPNPRKNNDLHKTQSTAYKPAYKENQKKQENKPENLSPDLAQIVAVWPELSSAIRSAIVAIVRSSNRTGSVIKKMNPPEVGEKHRVSS